LCVTWSMCVTWLIVCDMTHCVWHDSLCVTWLIVCDMTQCVTWLIVCDMTHCVWHDSLCMTWLIVYDMTHCVWHDSSYVAWLIQRWDLQMRDMTYSDTGHASFRSETQCRYVTRQNIYIGLFWSPMLVSLSVSISLFECESRSLCV